MREQDLKNKILKAADSHQLSLSSQAIIEKYEYKQKHRFHKRYFYIPAFTSLGALVVLGGIFALLYPWPVHFSGLTNGIADSSNVLTSVVCDLSFNDFVKPELPVNARIYKGAIDPDEFKVAVRDIDEMYDTFVYYYNHEDGLNYQLDSISQKIYGEKYHYQVEVNNSILYVKEDLRDVKKSGKFDAILFLDDYYYPSAITAKVSKGVLTTSLSYMIGNSTYVVGHEVKGENITISQKIYEDESLIHEDATNINGAKQSFVAEISHENRVDEVKKTSKFSLKNKANSFGVNYSRKISGDTLEYDDILLEVDSSRAGKPTHTYKLDGEEVRI